MLCHHRFFGYIQGFCFLASMIYFRGDLRNIIIKISLNNAIIVFQHILTAFLKVVSLNLPLTFLHFLNVAISMKVLWTWSTSTKRIRQTRNCEECIFIMEPFCNIIKCAVIQRPSGHGPKVLYVKRSKGPSFGHFYAAAIETMLLS